LERSVAVIYLGYVCSLIAFVCCILVGIKGIQSKEVLLGVLSILCWIVAVVMVFTKQRQWGISNNLKLALIISIIGSVVLQGVAYATTGPVVVVH
jgi:hypothetical protein